MIHVEGKLKKPQSKRLHAQLKSCKERKKEWAFTFPQVLLVSLEVPGQGR